MCHEAFEVENDDHNEYLHLERSTSVCAISPYVVNTAVTVSLFLTRNPGLIDAKGSPCNAVAAHCHCIINLVGYILHGISVLPEMSINVT